MSSCPVLPERIANGGCPVFGLYIMDEGFWGPDKYFYWWMLARYKAGQNVSKLKYWMFCKEMKAFRAAREKKRRYPKSGIIPPKKPREG
jgi:hypothetical protein